MEELVVKSKNELLKDLALRLAPVISDNNRREQEALIGYYQLLREIDDHCRCMSNNDKMVEEFWRKYLEPLRSEIEEIIADELNHSEKLNAAIVKFGMVKPAKD